MLFVMFVLTFHHLQEAEGDKASILEQFADLAQRKAIVDEQQAVLLTEMNGIKQQIQNFEQHRGEIMVSTHQRLPPDLA